jgi:hypothetical protein
MQTSWTSADQSLRNAAMSLETGGAVSISWKKNGAFVEARHG